MAKRPSKRSVCPVACTLDLIGDKWTLLIIRDLMCGKTRYTDFLNSPEGIATNILADRLDRLLEAKLIHATASDERAGTRAYELTERGTSLRSVVEGLRNWGLANIKGTAALMKPVA
jgi:DNA-binding HxlR family transcriptional regulator